LSQIEEPKMFTSARSFDADSAPATQTYAAPGRTAVAGGLEIELAIVTTRDGFDALEHEWNALFERAGRPAQVFQTFNWNWHWANHYLSSSPGGISGLNPCIVTGRRNGRLVMIWPLASERVRGITQIFWMGEPVSQYGDVVIDDLPDAADVLAAGWAFLAANAKGDVVRLRRIRADAAVAPLMATIGARVSDRQKAPYLDLTSAKSFEDYEQRYSPRSRRNRRRLARRIDEQGGLIFRRYKGGPEARTLAVKALELKSAWLKDRGLVSHAIADARMSRFFADAAEGQGKSTNCVVAALETNGDAAALEVSFTCKGRLAMHVIVFNLKYEKSGAGVLLLEQSIRDGYDDDLQTYDMLAPGDNYKLDWADNTIEVLDWVKPLSLAGFVYSRAYLGFLRSRAKTAIGTMPQSLRRIMTSGYAFAISILGGAT
jgi:CelD/BcsL family acetyltransferase involved in cellulose biosynthesis